MKLATFEHNGRASFGVVRDGGVIDVPSLWPAGPANVLQALQAGPECLAQIAHLATTVAPALPLKQVRLLAPVPDPPKVVGLAVNYLEHHREFDRGSDMPDDARVHTTPRPFIMPATCVIGDGDEIPWPAYSRQIDYEIELAVVIGEVARCVSPADALACVAGYTIANDVSARSVTYAEGRLSRPKDDFFDWLHGKWADGFCPLGPVLVTADEVGDPQSLEMELRVNGLVRQKSNTRFMIHSVAEIVSFISHIMTLTPGDVIATGTPSGVALADGRYLQGGDEILCRIERIGQLRNTLGRPPERFFAPCMANGA